ADVSDGGEEARKRGHGGDPRRAAAAATGGECDAVVSRTGT
uniref:Uncharacterized protein n=1 Tax=Aegilops tauschii subsp. strangulata TaxID=200361 RepID=A0A453I175_AEGTS